MRPQINIDSVPVFAVVDETRTSQQTPFHRKRAGHGVERVFAIVEEGSAKEVCPGVKTDFADGTSASDKPEQLPKEHSPVHEGVEGNAEYLP